MKNQIIFANLTKIVGENNVLIDQDSKIFYGKDLTQNYIPDPLAIVFPKTEEEIINIVRFANDTLIPLVPSGGRTGYSGGAVAAHQELVISFDKMNHIIDFNDQDKTVRCQPGVITKTLQDFAIQHGLFYPVDFASSGSSQLGGNIATNAGGIKGYSLWLNSKLGGRFKCNNFGNGDLLCLNHGLIKNASGYDLRQLFIGSEGTLGFITEATMRLISQPPSNKVILFAVPDKEFFIDILHLFSAIQYITAFEFFSQTAINYVIEDLKIPHPFPTEHPFSMF